MAHDRYFAGIDVGTAYVKAVIIDEKDTIIGSVIERTEANLQKSMENAYERVVKAADISSDAISHITGTGFGRKKARFVDSIKTEISAQAKGAYHYFPEKITVIDIGGQDTKIIKIDSKGKITGFKMNRKCAAGTGTFLEEIAYRLNLPLDDLNKLAARSDTETALNSFCTVFASTEILTRIKEGEKVEDMVKSAFESIGKRVIEMGTLEGAVVATGGVVEYNDYLLKVLSKSVGMKILTPPHPQLTGAFGAALFAREAKD